MKKVRDGFIILGVGHVLPESVREVRELIAKEKPEVVCLELCPARYHALTYGTWKTQNSSILIRLIYIFQERLAKLTGSPIGEEMLTAIEEARKVGALIMLIDQDMEITIRQLMGIPLREKFLMGLQILFSLFMPFEKKISDLTEEETVEKLLSDFRKFFPFTYKILVEQRNVIMANRLLPLLNSDKKVVCVVGAAHVKGILQILQNHAEKSWFSLRLDF
ncbi:MAG: TraB/GumN family protein [Candidatus Hadarchaeales archaeon]